MTVVGYNIPSNERFSFDAFVAEKEMEEIAKNIEFKDKERNKK